jgi:hypothetical protein
MKRKLILVLFLTWPTLVLAQFKSQTRPVGLGALLSTPAGIERSAATLLGLDPSRLQIHQSYEMSYLSLGGQGLTQGLYLNTMIYDFKFPLQIALQWGLRNQPFASSVSAPLLQNGLFVSAAQVRFRPLKNTLVQFDFRQLPYGYNPYGYQRSASMFDW